MYSIAFLKLLLTVKLGLSLACASTSLLKDFSTLSAYPKLNDFNPTFELKLHERPGKEQFQVGKLKYRFTSNAVPVNLSVQLHNCGETYSASVLKASRG